MRRFSFSSGVAAAILAAAAPFAFPAAASAETVAVATAAGGQGLNDFYAVRRGQPLWFAYGQPSQAASRLLQTVADAEVDGLDPRRYPLADAERALRAAWGGKEKAVRRADTMLSQILVSYVRDLRRAGDTGIVYVDSQLRPGPPSPRAILEAAARAPSLDDYVARMGWMNPAYGELRSALVGHGFTSDQERRSIAASLERARELPGGSGRYVLVNAAAQRLFMVEDGRVVDSMNVVVGKPKNPTPMMAAYIRYAALNPYWNVPPDLTAERIAPNVNKMGLHYLKAYGYEVLSDWGDNPTIVDPKTIDWKAVEAGTTEIRVRQLPGKANSMGQMKFMFPNAEGIYLHDTPDKQLLSEASRLFSGGCVRLEDAPRLAHWLFGRTLNPATASTEEHAPLPKPVPVYITYLTAEPTGSSIAFLDDIYGRDTPRLATVQGAFSGGQR